MNESPQAIEMRIAYCSVCQQDHEIVLQFVREDSFYGLPRRVYQGKSPCTGQVVEVPIYTGKAIDQMSVSGAPITITPIPRRPDR